MTDSEDRAEHALAQGLAEHVGRWGAELGASAEQVKILKSVAHQLSLACSSGNTCVSLAQAADRLGMEPAWVRRQLLATAVVATPAIGRTALILDEGDRLYLGRYFELEQQVAACVATRVRARCEPIEPEELSARLDALFAHNAPPPAGEIDWQRVAVALAATRPFAVISGGPGTGKTSTLVAILGCVLAQWPDLRIALAAPTGKAAARMLEAVSRRAQILPEAIRARLPQSAYTIHRLLGVLPQPGRYRHDRNNPLPVDLLVIDEASMLDLAITSHLLQALAGHTRLILLGDKDQLSSVEAGSVFADLSSNPALSEPTRQWLAHLCAAPVQALSPPSSYSDSQGASQTDQPPASQTAQQLASDAAIPDCVVWLRHSHRFDARSGIGELAREINAGRGPAALGPVCAQADGAVHWIDDAGVDLGTVARQTIAEGYRGYFDALQAWLSQPQRDDPGPVFKALDRFRVLCAIRQGPRGVAGINALVRDLLRSALAPLHVTGASAQWYPGHAVIVLRNDAALGLYNGDVGLCLPDRDGQPSIWFSDARSQWRSVSPSRLPEHDTAFAITVHKSQGSEFESVMLVMPQTDSRVATRELIYTAITRAMTRVAIVATRDVFDAACRRRTQRASGLREAINQALIGG
jgi:exodeoxyribonuclease V alpha subunit